MTTLTEQAATELLTDMQALGKLYRANVKQPGEFTTLEFAAANEFTKERAYAVLNLLVQDGKVATRRGGRNCYWRMVKE